MSIIDDATSVINAHDIVREIFPDVDDDEANGIIWARTGFPSFFHGDPAQCIREDLRRYAGALTVYPLDEMCDFCENWTPKRPRSFSCCPTCNEALERARR